LVELRDRLIKAVIAIAVVAAVLAVWPGPSALYDLLAAPLVAYLPKGATLIATSVISPFVVPLKILLMAAFLIALPVVLYQLWAFVAPGLYSHEKKLVLPLVVSSTVLFFAAWRSATSSCSARCSVHPELRAQEHHRRAGHRGYLSFVLTCSWPSASPSRCRSWWCCWCAWASSRSDSCKAFRGYFIVWRFIAPP
jgi:sec-independent protein translocase protein TatC